MSVEPLRAMTASLKPSETMPLLFLGHGSPMNALEENEFTKGWRDAGSMLPKPQAILCISAHWETRGTHVTAVEAPRTIHDFYGFPRALFEVTYPAPGSPELAEETRLAVHSSIVGLDRAWGLDHGCWSVARHLYPKADVPVVQLSLDRTKPARWHYELAAELSSLREKGVLIVGSGNMVHNLGIMDWENEKGGYDWAVEANDRMKRLVMEHDDDRLIGYDTMGDAFRLSIPTPEHYLPLLYVLGLRRRGERSEFFNDRTIYGSISMASLKVAFTPA